MKYYTVKEAAEELAIQERRLYDLLRKIETETPHQFGKMFLGNYFMGNPKKQKVISTRDCKLLKQLLTKIDDEKVDVSKVIGDMFSPSEEKGT